MSGVFLKLSVPLFGYVKAQVLRCLCAYVTDIDGASFDACSKKFNNMAIIS